MSEAYEKLMEFLSTEMRMSHIYQPVMVRHLLKNGGQASIEHIAEEILLHDHVLVEYYHGKVVEQPGGVLGGHGITTQDGATYTLDGFKQLSPIEMEILNAICTRRLNDYLNEGREWVWSRRIGLLRHIVNNIDIPAIEGRPWAEKIRKIRQILDE